MKRLLSLVLLTLSVPCLAGAQVRTAPATAPAVRNGSNPAAGHTFTHDGVTLYYEVYGAGERFFRTPFAKRDRIEDAFESADRLRASEGRAP